jgi:hypothetical protein
MKVKELCDGYKAEKTEAMKREFLRKNIKIRNYVPYAEKVYIARAMVEGTNLTEEGILKLDSPRQYLNQTYAQLQLYTDIEINESAWVEEYDQLSESGMLIEIKDLLPPKDLDEFDNIVEMVLEDLMCNQKNPWNLLGKFAEKLNGGMETLADTLNEIDLEKILDRIGNRDV